MTQTTDGVVDAAVLLMSLGADSAAQVFRLLSPKEAERLGKAMSEITTVEPEKITDVLTRLKETMNEKNYLVEDSSQYLKTVVMRALGEQKGSLLLDRIITEDEAAGIDNLRWMASSEVTEILRNEHPQIVASILVQLDRDQAAQVLAGFPSADRSEILLRITTLSGVQPVAMAELNEVLAGLLGTTRSSSGAQLGGTKPAAEILNFMGSLTEQEVIAYIEERDADLAQEISDQMFVFADLMNLDDKAIQLVLREVQGDSLITALKGADPDLREKILRNMSQRAAEALREDLESKGPVKVSEVEAEQKEIIKSAKRLADEGQLSLGTGGGDDDYV